MSEYFMCMCVFFCIPHDRATLRYCRSWSDSSEPAMSHSAALHTQGQQCHYRLLHTARQSGTEEHVCNFITDTVVTHTQTCTHTHAHGGLSGIKDWRPQTWWLIILRFLLVGFCDKSASVSITHPGQQEPLWPHPVDHWSAEESWSSSWKLLTDMPAERRRDRKGRTEEGNMLLEAGKKKDKRADANILPKDNTCGFLLDGWAYWKTYETE